MAFYAIKLTPPKCVRCGGKATLQIFRSGSDPRGTYCKRCGDAALKRMNGEDTPTPPTRRS